MLSRRLSTLILTCFAFIQVQAQQKHELTVQQAVDLAFKNVVELKNSQLDLELQQSKNKEITGQALPQVTGNAGLQHYLKLPQLLFPASSEGVYQVLRSENLIAPDKQAPPPVLQPVSFQQPWNTSVGATLTQLLFQPDVFVGLKARKTALEFSKANIEVTKAKIKDEAYKRYYAILIAEKQRDFFSQSVKRLEKLYADQEQLKINGFQEQLSLDQTEVQLANAKTTLSTIDNGISLAYASLKIGLGIPQQDTVVLKEELNSENMQSVELPQNGTYDDRPEMKSLQYTRELQKLDLRRNQLGYIPTVAAQANYTINGMGQNFITDKGTIWIKSSFVGVNVNIPIFDGFQRKQKIRQSTLNLQKLDNTISGVKQMIDLQQLASATNLNNAIKSLRSQERNIKLAEKVYQSTKTKLENGLASNTDLLFAEDNLQKAQGNYFEALYNAIISKIDYQTALGKLQ